MTKGRDSADAGPRTIAHLFADCGAEAEALSTYGHVFRFTLDPRPNPFDAGAWAMDLTESVPAGEFDLAVLHPPCTRWSDMPDVDPNDHPDLIDRAREIGETIADEWIVENKPKAWSERSASPSTVLDGRMFGLPIKYERAFETSFPVDQPARQQRLAETETSPFFYSERSPAWWASVKGFGATTRRNTSPRTRCRWRTSTTSVGRGWRRLAEPTASRTIPITTPGWTSGALESRTTVWRTSHDPRFG